MAKTEHQWKKCQVPSFGGWNEYTDTDNDKMSFSSDIFEMERARNATLFHYGGADLYDHDVATPAVIVVPCSRRRVDDPYVKVKGVSKKSRWVDGFEEPEPEPQPPRRRHRPAPKPVDEDLYKIPPDLLYAHSRKKRGLGFFSSCLLPTCAF